MGSHIGIIRLLIRHDSDGPRVEPPGAARAPDGAAWQTHYDSKTHIHHMTRHTQHYMLIKTFS